MTTITPPLPEPVDNEELTHRHRWIFTEAKLLAYREAVIEMCVKKCEEVSETQGDADECAAEIRSLK